MNSRRRDVGARQPLWPLLAGVACLLLAHLFAWAAWHRRPATGHAEVLGPGLGEVFLELEPGEFAGTLLLGGLRGLVCDVLWMRASGAKEAGRFYESVALFQLISRVQPRFEQVWEYMAHDMAYNIAVEVEGEDGKWAWFVAGLEANVRGVQRNPRSDRLLRHLAWMLQHKGETFLERVPRHDFADMLNPILMRFEDPVTVLPGFEPLPSDGLAGRRQLDLVLREGSVEAGERLGLRVDGAWLGGATVRRRDGRQVVVELDQPLRPEDGRPAFHLQRSNYRLAELCYRAALQLVERAELSRLGFVRRLIAVGIEKDGTRLRNEGQHHAALLRWIDALEDWQATMDWTEDPANGLMPWDIERARDSYRRNEGRLRRRAARLAEQIAPDPLRAQRTAEAIRNRDFAEARLLLDQPGWHRSLPQRAEVPWYDE